MHPHHLISSRSAQERFCRDMINSCSIVHQVQQSLLQVMHGSLVCFASWTECKCVTIGTVDEEAVSLDPSSRSSGPSRRAEDSDSMAILDAEVAVTFLFKVCATLDFTYTLCEHGFSSSPALLVQPGVAMSCGRISRFCCLHLCFDLTTGVTCLVYCSIACMLL